MTATVTITLCSPARLDHLRNQLRVLARSDAAPVVVWLDAAEAPADAFEGTGFVAGSTLDLVHVPPGPDGLRLAAGRNAGAERALARGADLLVFLDADCVPGPELLAAYRSAAAAEPDAVLSGPVTYLAPGVDVLDPAALAAATAPHAARPAPASGVLQRADPAQYALFWSLSFAVSAAAWRLGPRFDERYEGYGGEDTDFGFALREHGIPLVWTGGAHAYHQWHPTSSPPWQHVDDILRNGAVFAERWGVWPMTGWLDAFAAGGAVERSGSGWVRTSLRSSAAS